jgi:phosphatidylglycerol:prolipoprotein diacylglycerol transferase
MHPLLFRIPLPSQHLTLSAPLTVLGALALLLAAFGAFRGLRELTVAAAVAALAGFAAALFFRGHVLVLGALPLPSFGVLLALALALGVWLTLRSAKRDGLPGVLAADVCVAAIVGGVLGARLGYVLLHLGQVESVAHVFAFRDGGLTAHGAVLGALAGIYFAVSRSGTPLLGWLDAAAPGFVLGVAVTRVGCWLEGCDFGRSWSAPPPIFARLGTFPTGSRAWSEQVIAGELAASATHALPVHPTQLYEAAGATILLAIVLFTRGRKRRAGQLALISLGGYWLLRVAVDTWRTVSPEVWAARVFVFAVIAAALYFARARPATPSALRES